jgi:hypothetical protein
LDRKNVGAFYMKLNRTVELYLAKPVSLKDVDLRLKPPTVITDGVYVNVE